ncbi:hypothetical protein Avbf_17505 [Armadillidium vulgare]|nr:hypothetical protein Avbf_17505 [Armadillidium vulgare]
MIIGLISVLAIGASLNGGITETLYIASKGGRLEMFEVISYNVFGIVLIFSLIFPAGLVAYANYAGCDPMALGIIKRKEEIIPYFVMDKLSFIPGLPGIFVAALVGGSLSLIRLFVVGSSVIGIAILSLNARSLIELSIVINTTFQWSHFWSFPDWIFLP